MVHSPGSCKSFWWYHAVVWWLQPLISHTWWQEGIKYPSLSSHILLEQQAPLHAPLADALGGNISTSSLAFFTLSVAQITDYIPWNMPHTLESTHSFHLFIIRCRTRETDQEHYRTHRWGEGKGSGVKMVMGLFDSRCCEWASVYDVLDTSAVKDTSKYDELGTSTVLDTSQV